MDGLNPKLVENLWKKKQFLEDGDLRYKNIRTLLLILGGGMRGIYGVGAASALDILGLGNVFDVSVGVSTGARIQAYRLANQIEIGASIYFEECCGKEFINYLRFKKIADIDYIEAILKGNIGDKKLDIETLKKTRSCFFACAASQENNNPFFLNVKNAKPHLISAIKASMAMPFFYREAVKVNNYFYVDGSLASPFPIKEIIEFFNPTDVLVVANCDEEHAAFFTIEDICFSMKRGMLLSTLKKIIISGKNKFRDSLEYVSLVSDVNIGIIWAPDQNIGLLTRNHVRLFKAFTDSRQKVLDIFLNH